jgi:nicotinate-nucleotide adenylyltransferase
MEVALCIELDERAIFDFRGLYGGRSSVHLDKAVSVMSLFCFGGSFNPIHVGHLICARAAAEALGFERVTLVPSAQPPHKTSQTGMAPAADRLAMCRLAVQDDGFFAIDDLELHRPGPSYTIDTVRALRQNGGSDVHWLIGADMLAILPQWHEAASLVEETRFIVMARPGWRMDWQKLPRAYQFLRDHVVQVPRIDISATQIRQRVERGRAISYLVPRGVQEYIDRQGLYQSNP